MPVRRSVGPGAFALRPRNASVVDCRLIAAMAVPRGTETGPLEESWEDLPRAALLH